MLKNLVNDTNVMLATQCITGNTAKGVTGFNPSLSAGADVLQDRGPEEGHQAAVEGMSNTNPR